MKTKIPKNQPPMDIYPYFDTKAAQSKGVKKYFYKLLPIPLHTFYPLRFEIYAAIIRMLSLLTPIRFRDQKNLLINLGSGLHGLPGWTNVDIVKYPGINCLYDCRKKLPFPDKSVRGIFCEHFFEHLDYTEEIPFFLSECIRVLIPGGILRLIVPDAGRYLNAYAEGGWGSLSQIRPLDKERMDPYYLFRYRTPMELINQIFRQGHRHKYAYDFQTLDFILKRFGFSQVYQQAYMRTKMTDLGIDSEERKSESLYVEAVR